MGNYLDVAHHQGRAQIGAKWAALLSSACALSACCTQPPSTQALVGYDSVAAVQSEIKRQIAVYMKHRSDPVKVVINGQEQDVTKNSALFACGSGTIDFAISSVKAEIVAANETITDNALKLKFPIEKIKLGLTAEDKSDLTNTETLTYNLWLGDESLQRDPTFANADESKPAPIATVLQDLRKAIIVAALKPAASKDGKALVDATNQPCFFDFNPDKPTTDAGNSVKLQLQYVRNPSGGIDVTVGVVELLSSPQLKATTGNTLTVAFVQTNLAATQVAVDLANEACKAPKGQALKDNGKGVFTVEPSHDCKKARETLSALLKKTGVGLAAPPP